MVEFSEQRLGSLVSILRRRGIILPAFEIHGGAKGFYDFGPVGGRLHRRVIQHWVSHWLKNGNIVELSCPTVTPFQVLEASGHVGEFSDSMTTCNSCEEASRADLILEDFHPNPDALSMEELQDLLERSQPACPSCGQSDWSSVELQNLMFNTAIGSGKSAKAGFLRPETAQGMFTSFPSIYRHFRERLPFGALQVGKGYRNEIAPRQGMIRLREFNMAELEYFIDPEAPLSEEIDGWSEPVNLIADGKGEESLTFSAALKQGMIRHTTVADFMSKTMTFLVEVGIDANLIRFRQHEADEMAHYARDCWDAEVYGSYGWVECVGIAHRGCYDLEAHENATGQRLRAWRGFSEPRIEQVDGWTIDGAVAGPVFRGDAGSIKIALEKLPADVSFPLEVAIDERMVKVSQEHVKRVQRTESIAGEWYIPHVIEPAFGIDRIIWHILDHAFNDTGKDGEEYSMLRFKAAVAPVDYCVLPLFEKDGMGELALKIHQRLCAEANVVSILDGSGSIGRRYARADEIGVPICITVDHQSVEDGTVTLRQRDDGSQTRINISDLTS
jgi:glycyl-tRNA synthetase